MASPVIRHNAKGMPISKAAFSSAEYAIPAAKIEREVKKLRGVSRVSMNHVSLTILVEYDATKISVENIRSHIKSTTRRHWPT